MMTNYVKKTATIVFAFLSFLTINLNAAVGDFTLPLDNVNYISNGDLISYDAGTQTADFHYGGDKSKQEWQFVGWQWEDGKDFSNYKSVTIDFDASDLYDNPDDPAKLQLTIGYMDGDENVEVRKSATSASFDLDPDRKGTVKYVYLKSQYGGKIIFKDAYITTKYANYDLPLNNVNWISNGNLLTYDPLTQTIDFHYGGDKSKQEWQFYGWTWESAGGRDLSDFVSVVMEFDASDLYDNPDDPAKLQLTVGYMNGDEENVEFRKSATSASFDLNPDKKGAVKYIYLKSQYGGKVILKNAYISSLYADYELSLGAVDYISNGNLISYDAATQTIDFHYGGDKSKQEWQFAGWIWDAEGGKDFSAYKAVTIDFDASDLYDNPDDPAKLQLTIGYMDGDEENVEVRKSATSATIDLNPDKKGAVKYIYLKSQFGGKVILKKAYFPKGILTLSLDNINYISNGNLISYDQTTHTIDFHYDGDKSKQEWQFAGWIWEDEGGKNLSGYKSVSLEFDASDLYDNPDDAAKLQLTVGYMDGDEIVEVRKSATSASLDLNPDKKGSVKYIYLKSQYGGKVILKSAYLFPIDVATVDDYILPIENDADLGAGNADASYNGESKVVDFTAVGGQRGWSFDTETDFSAYKFAVVEFEPVDFGIQLVAAYNGDVADSKSSVNAGAKRIILELDEAGKADIEQIYLQSETVGQLTIVKAYLTITDIRKPDLIVTEITWAPENPAPGEDVIFSAKIKNIGEIATQGGIKHGVAFSVNGSVVSWSDSFRAADKFLEPGQEAVLEANGGTAGGAQWKCGKGYSYTIKAHVNDNPSDGIKNELDDTNNTLEKSLRVNGSPDLVITSINSSPSKPKKGDKVTFNAVVKNQGIVDSPAGIVHNLTFSINGTVVSWNDVHVASIPVGGDIRIKAEGGPGDVAAWTADDENFIVIAEINAADKRTIDESDYENNTLNVTYGTVGINDILAPNGNVYASNGALYITGYAGATVNITDMLGQQIVGLDSIDDEAIVDVPSGIYLVNILLEGKTATYKVLVK